MGQAESSPPLVEINYDELTYELLLEESKEQDREESYNPRKPQSLVQRLIMDSLGLFLLYIGTYVVCDLLKTLATGNWSRLIWAFLGPWDYVTGMPLYHKIKNAYQESPAKRCDFKYYEQAVKCSLTNLPWDADDCYAAANRRRTECIEQTDEYQTCASEMEELAAYWNKHPPTKGEGKVPIMGAEGVDLSNITPQQIETFCVHAAEAR